jgi:hypothetical protein
MAIIYSYPGKSTPSGGDVLVITDSAQPAPNKNRTKSLTIDNLAAYVVSSTSGITGSGTLNTIPLFTPDGQKIGDSIMTFTTGPDTITVGGRLSTTGDLVVGNRSTFAGYARFNGEVRDAANSSGTVGQVLTSTGAGTVAWASDGGGTVTSVALTMPAAFSVAGSPITSSGTFAVTGAGTASQVVLGDGTLGSLPGGPFLPLAGGTMLGNTLHGDNIKSIYGTGSDLEIYNNGTKSYIESKTANEDLILSINCFNGTEKLKIEDNNNPGDFLAEFSRFNTIIYYDASEVIKTTSNAVELTNQLELKSYTSTSVSPTGGNLNPNQNYQAATQDTLATLAVDPSGDVVRAEQEATWTFSPAQLNGTLGITLIDAPGANKAIIVTESDWMIKYNATGSISVNQSYEVRQASNTAANAIISILPGTRINEILSASQGVPPNPAYGFCARDIPLQTRTYKTNTATTLHKLTSDALPAGVISVSLKLKYRIFDGGTF